MAVAAVTAIGEEVEILEWLDVGEFRAVRLGETFYLSRDCGSHVEFHKEEEKGGVKVYDKVYRVTTHHGTGKSYCDCPDHRYRKSRCKHQIAAEVLGKRW